MDFLDIFYSTAKYKLLVVCFLVQYVSDSLRLAQNRLYFAYDLL